jgi:DNA-binding transcriptional ArsR family regulator
MSSENRMHLNDATELRALAHPARLAAVQHLMQIGPATATQLGEVARLTPSAMSYHLRSLERAGLIETAPSRGDGRERVWRSVHAGFTITQHESDTDDEMRMASVEVIKAMMAAEEIDTRRWLAQADEPGWVDTGHFMGTVALMSQEELETVAERISALIEPYKMRNRGGTAPADAVQTRLFFRGIPAG